MKAEVIALMFLNLYRHNSSVPAVVKEASSGRLSAFCNTKVVMFNLAGGDGHFLP